MKPVLRFALMAVCGLAVVCEGAAQDSWVGKTIIVKKPEIKIGMTDDAGNQVYVGKLDNLSYPVLAEKDGWLKVADARGSSGWFDKADAVLLDDATAYFTDRIRQNDNDALAYNARGWAWHLKGDHDNAIKDYDELLRRQPSAFGHNNRGVVWIAKKEYYRAVSDFDDAIRLDPQYAIAYRNRGLAWTRRENIASAIADFTECIRIEPKFLNTYVNRGDAWVAQRRYDKAIEDFGEVIRLDPRSPFGYSSRGAARLNNNDLDGASADLTEAIRLAPNDPFNYLNRGVARARKLDHDKAIADYTEALRLNPKYPLAFANRANAWRLKKEYDKAHADCEEALRLDPKFINALFNRGSTWESQKEYGKAIADYNEVIRLNPKHMFALYNRACMHARQDQPDLALADLSRALELGYRNLAHLEKDKDLESIRNEARFKDLVQKYAALHAEELKVVRREPNRLEGSLTYADTKVRIKLSTSDIELSSKVYDVKLQAGTKYQVDMISGGIDSFLVIQDSAGKQLAYDDDGGGFPNARIVFTPTKDDTYRLFAATLSKEGRYLLTIEPPVQDILAAAPSIGEGVTYKGRLSQQAKKTTYEVKLIGGTTYQIDMTSPDAKALDPYLFLHDDTGKELERNDDGGGYPNARITFKAPATGTYRIIAASFLDQGDGEYTLTIREPGPVPIGRDGVRYDDSLSPQRKSLRYDVKLVEGRTYVIDMTSPNAEKLDPYLYLRDDAGKELERNDDGGGYPNARITFRAPATGTYQVIASSYQDRGDGRFTLTIREKD